MTGPFNFIAYQGKRKVPVVVQPPSLDGAPLVETHAHLDMLPDPAIALARAAYVGLTAVLTIADVSEDAERTYRDLSAWQDGAQRLLDQHALGTAAPEVRIIVGIHPHNALTSTRRQNLVCAPSPKTHVLSVWAN